MGGSVVGRRGVLLGGAAVAAGLSARPSLAKEAAADGSKVYWAEAGKGAKTLIFVHGWTGDTTLWDAQVAEFAKRYRVIVLDLPGHGRSQQPAGGVWSIEMFARGVEAVRAAAGAERAILIGHSMGALVIRQYALMYPQRVEALVLADGLIQGPPTGPPRPARVMTGPEGMKNRAAMLEGMFTPRTPPAVKAAAMKTSFDTAEATAAGAMAATADTSTRSAAPVTIPVLGIYAEASKVANPETRKLIYPTMQYQEIPGTGHFLMMEKPAAFNAALGAFLAGLG